MLHYASYKSRRRGPIRPWRWNLCIPDAFDFASCAKRDLEKIFSRHIPLAMFTDSKSLFDAITKGSQTQEKRLMIDLEAVRDAYGSQEMSNVRFLQVPDNPADGPTKTGHCAALYRLLRYTTADFSIARWVFRTISSPKCSRITHKVI